MYTEEQLVRIAKRENNNKRKYLVVNRLQGKHIPVSPEKALEVFEELARIVKSRHSGERLLVIGFAETATAIGAAVAASMDCYYIQTTREVIAGKEYLYFAEAHSHATEQKLVKDGIDSVISDIDRIIFIEDEVTTGNTIMNIINILESRYPDSKASFAVASLLNGMNKEAESLYREKNILLHYLVKTNHEEYESKIEDIQENGSNFNITPVSEGGYSVSEIAGGYIDARTGTDSGGYLRACMNFCRRLKQRFKVAMGSRVLVLGTEEFMYPALLSASEMQRSGVNVRFHATTRSPIAVSADKSYPLHTRYRLKSLYDRSRVTYLYELEAYDYVFVITDAPGEERTGLESLIAALKMCGNKNIQVVRWCEN